VFTYLTAAWFPLNPLREFLSGALKNGADHFGRRPEKPAAQI